MTNRPPENKRLWFWLAVAVAFIFFLFAIRSILLPFVLGTLTAYFLDPAADRLEKMGLSRARSTLVITACFFISIILLSILILPILASQIAGLISALPAYLNDSEHKLLPVVDQWVGGFTQTDLDNLKASVSEYYGVMVKFAGEFIAGVFFSGMAVVNVLSLFLITPVVAFYLLEDWDRIMAHIDNWLPRAHAKTIRRQMSLIDQTLAGFLRGQLNVCLMMAVYYTLLLSITGLHFSILIGIVTGFLIIIPYAGWTMGACTALAVAIFQFNDWGHIGMVAGTLIAGMVIEGTFLTPKLVGSKVGLHPVWIIFGMLSGAALFGFVGILLAVPATAVIGVLIRFALERYLASSYYSGKPAHK